MEKNNNILKKIFLKLQNPHIIKGLCINSFDEKK